MKDLKKIHFSFVILLLLNYSRSQGESKEEYRDVNGNVLNVTGDQLQNSKVKLVTNIPEKIRDRLEAPGPTTVVQNDSSYMSKNPILNNNQPQKNAPKRNLMNIPDLGSLINQQNIDQLSQNTGGFVTSMLDQATTRMPPKGPFNLNVQPNIIYDQHEKKRNNKITRNSKITRNRKLFDRGQVSYPYAGQMPSNSILVPGEQFYLDKTQEPVSSELMNRIRAGKASSVMNFYEKTEERVIKGREDLNHYQETISNDNTISKLIGKINSSLSNLDELKDSIMNKLESKIGNFKEMRAIYKDLKRQQRLI